MTKPADKGLQPIAQLLEDVLTEHGVREQMEQMRAITLWPDVVGEIVAGATKARAVDEGALIVAVTSSAWLMELNMMKGDLLAKVNEHLGESRLNKIVFVLAETA
ncbi:MAG: DUF721 domain-containing protein [Gemmatimonadota bacterium]